MKDVPSLNRVDLLDGKDLLCHCGGKSSMLHFLEVQKKFRVPLAAKLSILSKCQLE